MKKMLLVAIGLAAFALVQPLGAGAVSHNLANVPSCISCHNTPIPDGPTFNTACLQCHDVAASNPAVTHKLDPSRQGGTSHSWSGNAANPAAGAQKPTSGALVEVSRVTGSTLACVNCHNPHATNNAAAGFLRTGTADQLCLDCHRSRNVTSHRVDPTRSPASHPVNVKYQDAAAAGGFSSAPGNAALSAGLTATGGTLLCSTCHDVHDSVTQDGSLLRAEARGAAVTAGSADNANFCTSCHTGKYNHNAKGQDIQCLDCHAAHVDFDPADPAGAQGTNVSLVRRYLPGKTAQTFFRAGDGYKNGDGSGVCQSCHAVPTGNKPYGALHDSKGPADCKTCHSHANAKGSFGANVACGGCHALPPTDSVFYSGVQKYAHKAGDTACDSCHTSATATTHNDGTVNLVTGANPCSACHAYPPASPAHTTATTAPFNCTFCHLYTDFNGSLHNNGSLDLNVANLTCTTCHPTLSSSHAAHVGNLPTLVTAYGGSDQYFLNNNTDATGYRFGCAYCHPTTNPNHWNGTIVLTGNGFAGTSKANITCSATLCHSDGKGGFVASPNWYTGFVGQDRCSMCHAAAPTTGAHFAHTSINGIHDGSSGISYPASYSCVKCHSSTVDANRNIYYPNHVNGTVRVSFVAASEVSRAQLTSVDPAIWTRNGSIDTSVQPLSAGSYANATCSNIACHNNLVTPAWNSAVKISCVDCHSKL